MDNEEDRFTKLNKKKADFKICLFLLSHDCCFAVRTYRDDLDRNTKVLLHECDILAELSRKFLLCAAVSKVCIPSLELSVYRLNVSVCVEWPLVRRLSVNYV
jgi:hypothetical protein